MIGTRRTRLHPRRRFAYDFWLLLRVPRQRIDGTASLWLGQVKNLEGVGQTWLAWWAGDALGCLIVAPLILVWATRSRTARLRSVKFNPWKILEAVSLAAVFALTGAFVFGEDSPHVFWFFPMVVWGALRFGQRGSVTITFLISVLAIWQTLAGRGPFAHGTQRGGLFLLVCFMVVIATTGMMLAATLLERKAALRASKKRTKTTVLISRAGQILNSSLEFDTTLSQIAKIVVPRLADWCTIDVLEGSKDPDAWRPFTFDPRKNLFAPEY